MATSQFASDGPQTAKQYSYAEGQKGTKKQTKKNGINFVIDKKKKNKIKKTGLQVSEHSYPITGLCWLASTKESDCVSCG